MKYRIKITSIAVSMFSLLSMSSIAQKLSVDDPRLVLPEAIADKVAIKKYSVEEIDSMRPPSANPMLSMPESAASIDWGYWNARNQLNAERRTQRSLAADKHMNIGKMAKNNSPIRIPRFGNVPGAINSIDVSGTSVLPAAVRLDAGQEDEGSIPLATDVSLMERSAATISANIGDGLFGQAGTGSGDYDFYAIRGVSSGQMITVRIDAQVFGSTLDSFIVLYNSAGDILAFNDDRQFPILDSELRFMAPADDDYYVSVGAFGGFALNDPFDSASGPGSIFGGALIEGDYDITIGLEYFSEINFLIGTRASEVFSANLQNLSGLMAFSEARGLKTLRIGSSGDASGIYPEESPLIGGGTVSLASVIDRTGEYRLRALITESGSFTVQLRAFQPTLAEAAPGSVQKIFVDFDGAEIDTGAVFLGLPEGELVSNLSPLSSFLANWGLTADDEDAVIDGILGAVEESLLKDIGTRGRNPRFKIELLNSRDHADPFGEPNVSRLIVGGTIPEFFIGTLGIAESIDVGNFATEESAVILLDLLSDVPANPNSLNQYGIASGSSIIDLIAQGVGNIVSHEAGHYLGNFHTDQFNEQSNIMDAGGNLAGTVGVGPDLTFGTTDDEDVDFGKDTFIPSEGFLGTEDTLNTTAFGATTPSDHSH